MDVVWADVHSELDASISRSGDTSLLSLSCGPTLLTSDRTTYTYGSRNRTHWAGSGSGRTGTGRAADPLALIFAYSSSLCRCFDNDCKDTDRAAGRWAAE